jgi:hypothetical protein
MDDDRLDARLAALESRVPVLGAPPAVERRVRRRLASPAIIAATLTLTVGAGALAGGAILEGLRAQSHPGVQNAGQPLHGAKMECMSPQQAERFLIRKGFTSVVWQVESGSGKAGRSVQQASAPEHGYVVPGSIIDGTLHMVVDQRTNASGVGACIDMRMP